MKRFALSLSLFLFAATLTFTVASASAADHRLGPLKTLDDYFPFTPPSDWKAWEARAADVRLRVRVATGLHPMPPRGPLNAVIHGRREMDGYILEKVYFESAPGYYLTGNLYRPIGVEGKVPGVLYAHGHWTDGRMYRASDAEVARELATGAEKREEAARSPLIAPCVHLARMGCVVFQYDMVGNADHLQLSRYLGHGFNAQRPEMNAAEGWGFYSPQAESRLQSVMGLQTWNSVRALDFLTSLPEVDPERTAVTGASGGGTQTFILCAIDPRPAAAFPAVMVSTAMQGGCTCENACLLRVGTGNVEIAALFAPKPLGLTAADDWTKEMSVKGFPELKALYRLAGAPDHVSLLNRTEFPHNYNLHSRLAMYKWFAKHLKTPRPAPEEESPFVLPSPKELSVWDDAHPAPKADDPDLERRLLKLWDATAKRRIAENPKLIDEALPVLLGRTWAEAAAGPFSDESAGPREDAGDFLRIAEVVAHEGLNESVRCEFLYPKNWNGRVLVRLGHADRGDAADAPGVAEALKAGTAVATPELFTEPGVAKDEARHVPKDRDFLGYTYGYNTPPLARRAHDILTLLAWMKQHARKPAAIEIDCAAGAVPETALALTQVPEGVVESVAFEKTDFRFANISRLRDPRLLPGAVKYGDLPAMLERVKAARKDAN